MSSNITYKDQFSILVVNPVGKMRQLYVPFRVQVIQSSSGLTIGSWVIVEEIRSDQKYKLIYKIMEHWLPYHLFRLSVVF
jgi:hypothetical protein